MDGWMDGWMDRWIDGFAYHRLQGRVHNILHVYICICKNVEMTSAGCFKMSVLIRTHGLCAYIYIYIHTFT